MSLLVVHPGVVYPRQRSSVSVLFKPVDGLDVDNRIPFGSEQVDEEGGSTRSITRDRCTKALTDGGEEDVLVERAAALINEEVEDGHDLLRMAEQ